MAPLMPLVPGEVSAAREARGLVAVFDVDGVLAAIVERPELAQVAPAVLERLATLAQRADTLVGVVSGRPLPQVEELAGVAGAWLSGLHGAARRQPDGTVSHAWTMVAERHADVLEAALHVAIGAPPGVRFERKGPVVALHVRGADPAATAAVEEAVRAHCPAGWEVVPGRRVFELRPEGLPNKGDAVRWLAGQRPGAAVLYVGDDTTDEDAFATLGRGDFPVLVDPLAGAVERGGAVLATQARFTLPSQTSVQALLDALAA
ncbi:MAG: trehalose-phosphatase [bacterium]|nr:trehalose-phosphatase [bacterium]